MRLLSYIKERWKKIFKISLIVLVMLYFIANVGLFFFVKQINEGSHTLNVVPAHILLSRAEIEGESLPIMGFKMVFPFSSKNISNVYFSFYEHGVSSVLVPLALNEQRFSVTLEKHPILENKEIPLWVNINDKLCGFDATSTFFDVVASIRNSSINDFSFWNLPTNLCLLQFLIIKAITDDSYESYEMYAYESYGIRGLMSIKTLRRQYSKERKYVVESIFTDGEETYSVSFVSVPESQLGFVKGLLSTIAPIESAGMSNGSDLAYPVKLALLSRLSIEGLSVEVLERLLELERAENNESTNIEQIEQELDYLKQNSSKM